MKNFGTKVSNTLLFVAMRLQLWTKIQLIVYYKSRAQRLLYNVSPTGKEYRTPFIVMFLGSFKVFTYILSF